MTAPRSSWGTQVSSQFRHAPDPLGAHRDTCRLCPRPDLPQRVCLVRDTRGDVGRAAGVGREMKGKRNA
jgi:hypothetical protein